MTTFFTKLASAVSALALVATIVPAAALAEALDLGVDTTVDAGTTATTTITTPDAGASTTTPDTSAGTQTGFSTQSTTVEPSAVTVTVSVAPGASLQDAIDGAQPGDTIQLQAGEYLVGAQLNLNKSVIINGASEETTTINVSGSTNYGIYWTADNATISNLTVKGPAGNSSKYGLKIQGVPDGAGPVTNVTLTNVTVQNSGGSEIDLHYVVGAVLTNVNADGQNTAGVGVAVTDSQNVTLDGITTTGNVWGGVAIYTANAAYFPGATDSNNITVSNLTAAENIKFFKQEKNGDVIGSINASGWSYAVKNPVHRTQNDGHQFTYYQKSEADAVAFAVGIQTAPVANNQSTIQTVDGNGKVEENYIVGQGMSIQTAVNVATSGATITLAGNVEQTSSVIIDKAITLDGNGNTLSLNNALSGGSTTEGLGLSNGATVRELIVTGSVADNLIEVTGAATLTDVTVNEGKRAGITVLDNGQLTLNGTTKLNGNVYGGINLKNVPTAKLIFASDANLEYAVGTSTLANAPAVYVVDAGSAVITNPENFVTDPKPVLAAPFYVAARVATTTPTKEVWWNVAPVVVEENNGNGGRSGGSRRVVTTDNTGSVDGGAAGEGQVLGASTYNFTTDLTIGSQGPDVVALQQMLIEAGFLVIDAPTGYFGEMTRAALAKWQAANGVSPAAGYFGPLTRAAVDAAAPVMTDAARAALIKDLLEKVKELQEKLDEMNEDAA